MVPTENLQTARLASLAQSALPRLVCEAYLPPNMNALVISQETVDSQLADCVDGETGDFTVTGGTFKLVPGVGAVVSGDTITKKGYGKPSTPAPEISGDEEMPRKGGMSTAAAAVVGRKGKGY